MEKIDALECVLSSAVTSVNGSAEAALNPILRYDAEHSGDLLRTLRVYLELGCNASQAAEALFLHRSGLLYRLGRIEGLLGRRLDCFEDRVALEIAVLAVRQNKHA